jgi:hypothetical protein
MREELNSVSLLEKIRTGETAVSVNPVFSDADGDGVPDTVPDGWLEPDPAPGAAPARPRGPVFKPTTSGAITPAMRKRIAAELEAYGQFLAMPILLRDETCGAVVQRQVKPAADALADILAEYPDIAHKFMATGILGKWMKLFATLWPVFQVVYAHHIARTPDDEESDGVNIDEYAPYRPGQ